MFRHIDDGMVDDSWNRLTPGSQSYGWEALNLIRFNRAMQVGGASANGQYAGKFASSAILAIVGYECVIQGYLLETDAEFDDPYSANAGLSTS